MTHLKFTITNTGYFHREYTLSRLYAAGFFLAGKTPTDC
jgi:hypothetical protein